MPGLKSDAGSKAGYEKCAVPDGMIGIGTLPSAGPIRTPHALSEFLRVVPANGIAVLRILAAETQTVVERRRKLQAAANLMVRALWAADAWCMEICVVPKPTLPAQVA